MPSPICGRCGGDYYFILAVAFPLDPTVKWELPRNPPIAAVPTQGHRITGALLLISMDASDRTFPCLTFSLLSALLLEGI